MRCSPHRKRANRPAACRRPLGSPLAGAVAMRQQDPALRVSVSGDGATALRLRIFVWSCACRVASQPARTSHPSGAMPERRAQGRVSRGPTPRRSLSAASIVPYPLHFRLRVPAGSAKRSRDARARERHAYTRVCASRGRPVKSAHIGHGAERCREEDGEKAEPARSTTASLGYLRRHLTKWAAPQTGVSPCPDGGCPRAHMRRARPLAALPPCRRNALRWYAV